MHRFARLLLLLALVIAAATSACADTWDYNMDFPVATATDHDWSVGFRKISDGSFTLFNTKVGYEPGVNGWYMGGYSGGVAFKNFNDYRVGGKDPNQALLHAPDNLANQCTARWTSPVDQFVRVVSKFTGQDDGLGVLENAFVYKNGVQVATGPLSGFYGTVDQNYQNAFPGSLTLDYSGSLHVAAGESIDFSVEAFGGRWGNNSTGLYANIATVPEPTTLASLAMMMGMIGGAVRRRRAS